jgi:hypothetical protein
VIDASESPWKNAKVIGRILDRVEALAHPLIDEVFHITDHMVEDDALLRSSSIKALPNQRMKLPWRGGRLKGKGFVLMAAAAPRSLCAIR